MGAKNFIGVRRITKRGKAQLLVDFLYVDKSGVRRRFRRLASVQTWASAVAEAGRLMRRAAEYGEPEEPLVLKQEVQKVPTYGEFYRGTFTTSFIPLYRPSTRERYEALHRQRVLKFFEDKRLDEIGTEDLRAFAAELQAEGIVVKGSVNVVRTVLRAAEETKIISAVPSVPRGLIKSGRKLPDAPSREEVDAMLKVATGWLRVAIALGALAGLREGEVTALEVQDIDFTNGRVLVRRAFSGKEVLSPKSTHERDVPMTPELTEILREAVKDKLPRARVIATNTGSSPTRQIVLARLKALQRANELRERSFHSLRHFFCSELGRQGVGAEVVRILAGHSSLQVTQRYMHANDDDKRNAVAKLAR